LDRGGGHFQLFHYLNRFSQLATGGAGWSNFAGTPVQVGDEFELTIGPALTPPDPIRFFRLHSP